LRAIRVGHVGRAHAVICIRFCFYVCSTTHELFRLTDYKVQWWLEVISLTNSCPDGSAWPRRAPCGLSSVLAEILYNDHNRCSSAKRPEVLQERCLDFSRQLFEGEVKTAFSPRYLGKRALPNTCWSVRTDAVLNTNLTAVLGDMP
jgi:hypothetical protein